MDIDNKKIKEIAGEYETILKSDNLNYTSKHIGLLEFLLKKHLNPTTFKDDTLFDRKFLKELEKSEGGRGLALRISNCISTYLHYKGISYNYFEITNGDILTFYNDPASLKIRDFGKKSHEFLGRYLLKKGLISENEIIE